MAFRFRPIIIRRLSAPMYPLPSSEPNLAYRQLFIRHLRIKNPLSIRDAVVYVRPPFWVRFSRHPLTIGALLLTIVDRYNTIKTIPGVGEDYIRLKLRLGNLWKAKPTTLTDIRKALTLPPKSSASGGGNSCEEMVKLMGRNHTEVRADIKDVKEQVAKSWWSEQGVKSWLSDWFGRGGR